MNILKANSNISINDAKNKIVDINQLAKNVKNDCIFTKGVFDILHYGHLSLFFYLKSIKDEKNLRLVVGVTSDKIVKMKKGNKRPINPENERLLQIALLPQVDYVYLHDEFEYSTVISLIQPKIYIKGMDTAGKNLDEPSLENSNPEFKMMPSGSTVSVFCDDDSISTSVLIKRINEID